MFKKKKPQFTDEIGTSGKERFLVSTFGPKHARWISATLEILQVFVLSLALVLLIRTFLVQPFRVHGASMEPSFIDREYLIIDELSYRFREPVRGETVVFRYPQNPREFFIKRIIGTPGETLEATGGRIHVINDQYPKGIILKEDYLLGAGTSWDRRVSLGVDEYYLLGDNRGQSLDSRMFGPVRGEAIVGRVWFRGWPLGRFGVPELPEYNF